MENIKQINIKNRTYYFFKTEFDLTDCYVIIMARMSFRVNPHSIICRNVKELLVQSRRHI